MVLSQVPYTVRRVEGHCTDIQEKSAAGEDSVVTELNGQGEMNAS